MSSKETEVDEYDEDDEDDDDDDEGNDDDADDDDDDDEEEVEEVSVCGVDKANIDDVCSCEAGRVKSGFSSSLSTLMPSLLRICRSLVHRNSASCTNSMPASNSGSLCDISELAGYNVVIILIVLDAGNL